MEKKPLRRIRRMERLYDSVRAALRKDPGAVKKITVAGKLRRLTRYMESGLWQQDYECDERGELPEDLKRGVLSQDGLYDLLQSVATQ